jgi:hypothetical protein
MAKLSLDSLPLTDTLAPEHDIRRDQQARRAADQRS